MCAHIDKYKLQERFDRCKTVAGIRSHHCFIPTSSNCISMKRVSEDDTYTSVRIGTSTEDNVEFMDYQPGRYIACTYDAQWYIGCVKDRSDEHSDILVSFMKRSAQNALSWPRRKDECWVPFQHVICRVNSPDVVE